MDTRPEPAGVTPVTHTKVFSAPLCRSQFSAELSPFLSHARYIYSLIHFHHWGLCTLQISTAWDYAAINKRQLSPPLPFWTRPTAQQLRKGRPWGSRRQQLQGNDASSLRSALQSCMQLVMLQQRQLQCWWCLGCQCFPIVGSLLFVVPN